MRVVAYSTRSRVRSRAPWVRIASIALGCVAWACSKPAVSDPTRDYFESKRADFVVTRDRFRTDVGLLTAVRKSPLGRIAGASGMSNACSSPLRGGELPWRCAKTGASVATLAEADQALGLPAGRLEEYERVLPAKQVSYVGTYIQFSLVDNEGTPGQGLRNIVWSDVPPPATFDPLGDGFYIDRR